MMLEYCTGIDQPAKSTIRPPCFTCQFDSGVCLSAVLAVDMSGVPVIAVDSYIVIESDRTQKRRIAGQTAIAVSGDSERC